MSEGRTNGLGDDRINFESQYGGPPINFLLRFEPYRHARKGELMHHQVVEEVDSPPDGRVLDVGCSLGGTLKRLRTRFPHMNLLGVDVNHRLLVESAKMVKSDEVGLMVGDANRLPVASESIDSVLSLFMLYHLREPSRALEEFGRVLRPGGQLIVATSGARNKSKHRVFERRIAEFLSSEPPSWYAERFNIENAEELLSQSYSVEKEVRQETEMVFTAEDIIVYLFSLLSMKDDFRPIPRGSAWKESIDEVVLPEIKREIEENGEFTDTIDRAYYVCTKPD